MIHTGARTARPAERSSTTSSAARPSRRPGVGPRLEGMELGDVPRAARGGLISEEPEMDRHADIVECTGKGNIRRRGVHRIAAQDEQELYSTLIHVVHELA